MKKFAAPLAIVLAALAVRLLFLGEQSLWFDEAYSYWMSSHPVRQLLRLMLNDAHPPLFYLFLHFWEMAGRSEVSLRLPFVAFGATNCLLVYAIGKSAFNEKTGMLSAIFWAFSAVAANEETQARMYAMALTFSLLATYCLWRACLKPSLAGWSLYALAAALSLYTHYYTVFILFAHGIFLMSRRRYKESLFIGAALFAVFLPWLPSFLHQLTAGAGTHMSGTGPADLFFDFALMLGTGTLFPDKINIFVSLIGIGLLALGCWKTIQKDERAAWFLLPLFAVPCFIPFAIASSTPLHVFVFRYVILFTPYFIMLVVRGLAELPGAIGYACFTFFVLANLTMWILFVTGPAYQRQNWRDAAALLRRSMATGDAIFFEQPMCMFPLSYYLPEYLKVEPGNGTNFKLSNPTKKIGITWYMPEEGFFRRDEKAFGPPLENAARHSKRAWIILCETRPVDLKLLSWFLKNEPPPAYFRFKSVEKQNDINVYLFTSRGGESSTIRTPAER